MGSRIHLTFSPILLCMFVVCAQAAIDLPQPASGLSWTFYSESCPKLEAIVKRRIKYYLNKDITQAAGLLRLHFHDCFVQGCDGSVLLDGTASKPSEKDAPPNLSLRAQAFAIIDDIKQRVEAACEGIVSCSDIVTLAARDSVTKSGGPNYPVPLGRRDSLKFATTEATIASLPSPSSNLTELMSVLSKLGLDFKDLVALSGGHTIGSAHCTSFSDRLYPTRDRTMERHFAHTLKSTCPKSDTDDTTNLDLRSPNVFDNKYYVDLLERQTLFTSDQTLYTEARTRNIVKSFADDQALFFEEFVLSMLKMGQLNVLTGKKGEIRKTCNIRNPTSVRDLQGSDASLLSSM